MQQFLVINYYIIFYFKKSKMKTKLKTIIRMNLKNEFKIKKTANS
jgi:hypothetical protein